MTFICLVILELHRVLRSPERCVIDELGVPIGFKHLQRITKGIGIRYKRPKLELLHEEDYEDGKESGRI